MRADVVVQIVERFVSLVVDVVAQVVPFTRQLARLGARMVVDGGHDAQGKLGRSAADGHYAERHRRRHLSTTTHTHGEH